MGNFEYHAIPLFLICVHLFDNGFMKHLERIKTYKTIFDDILDASMFNYNLIDPETNKIKSIKDSGYFFPEFAKNPKKYLYDYSAKEVLKHLKNKGIGVFFATNSFYEFAEVVMKNTIGEDYLEYFDLGVYFSKKPAFFDENSTNKGYFPDVSIFDNKVQPGFIHEDLHNKIIFDKLKEGKTFIEGNYKMVEKFFSKIKNKENLKFIYVGDNIYSDCLHPPKLENWESVAVSDHLTNGFIGNKPADFKKVWEIENYLGIKGENHENIFFTKLIRDKTLFTVSNVDSFKHLK